MISDEEKQIIRRFMHEVICAKGFNCLSGGPKDLCKARDIGSDIYVECLEAMPHLCSFSMSFGETNFCKCPVRIYLERKHASPAVTGFAEREGSGKIELSG